MYISRLHIIGADTLMSSQLEMAEMACRGGADWIQARIKDKTAKHILDIVEKMKLICDYHQAKLIINDHVKIAKKIKAYGVHLGKEDMSVAEARKILGKKFVIGATANTAEDVKLLISEGADYIGLGPYRFTSTKKNLSPVLGIEGIKEICNMYAKQIPIIAIGGIEITNLENLYEAGIYGIAVSSAIADATDPVEACASFIQNINQLTHEQIADR
jgi:thiamine-phosphate pyrophosphorylase